MATKVTSWHRRQAMQLAIQLPEQREDAMKIVACVNRLVSFLYGPPVAPPGGNGRQGVLPFPGGASSPRRRASSSGNASIRPK